MFPLMLLKHERQAYKVFFKAVQEANLANSRTLLGSMQRSNAGEKHAKYYYFQRQELESFGRDGHRDVATATLIEVWIDETERRTWFLLQTKRGRQQ